MTRDQLLADWTAKARLAKRLTAEQQLWPAWSMGELLAVAVILDDTDMLRSLDYTRLEALERLRHEIGEPTAAAAAAVFTQLAQEIQ